MIRKILIAAGVALAIGIVALVLLGWWAWHAMTGPLYEPGGVARWRTLQPPATEADDGPWLVERDVRLHHFARGRGRTVLFVHGGPGFPTREPMPWLERLGDAYTIRYYDQRGCGASTRPVDRFESDSFYNNMTELESALGLGVQVADIERIRRLLGEERLLLVGHSFGGFLATLYAAEFPQRVQKLILLAPADVLVMPGEREGLFEIVRDRLTPTRAAAFDGFLERYLEFGDLFAHDETELARMNMELGQFILEGMGRDPLPAPAPGIPLTAGGWMVQGMYMSMGRHHDYRDALAGITADTLVVHGEGDLAPATASAEYVDLIDGARMLMVPGADHFFQGDQPELEREARAFLGDG